VNDRRKLFFQLGDFTQDVSDILVHGEHRTSCPKALLSFPKTRSI
jgi:hypothetical protein